VIEAADDDVRRRLADISALAQAYFNEPFLHQEAEGVLHRGTMQLVQHGTLILVSGQGKVTNRDIQMLRDALGNQLGRRDLRGMGSPLKSLGELLLDLNRIGGHAFSRCLRRWWGVLPTALAVARRSRRNKVEFRSISIVVSRKQL
jgi:hypothetical protein